MPRDLQDWCESVLADCTTPDTYQYPWGVVLVHFGAQYSPIVWNRRTVGEQYVFENTLLQYFYQKGVKVNYAWDEDEEGATTLLRRIQYLNTED